MLALPFGASQFDVVTIGYGLRNVPDIERAIAEIRRVLADGGRMLSLDFNKPANPLVRAAYLTYLTVVGSILGLAAARRSQYLSLHPRVDSAVSRRRRRGATAGASRVRRMSRSCRCSVG